MDALELLQAQVLSYDQNFLPMVIGSQYLGTLPNDKHSCGEPMGSDV